MEMTQEWIEQYNRKCAEFMGYELITPEMRKNPEKWNTSYWEHKDKDNIHTALKVLGSHGYLSYHSDWNWIMKVVEKIESLENIYFQIEEKSCYVYDISKFSYERMDSFIQQDANTKKEAVIRAIDQFIDWYNKQKEI